MHQIDVGLDLLDRQIVDCEGKLVGKVDDVEITDPTGDAPPSIVAMLTGPIAFGERVHGPVGRWIASTARRYSSTDTPVRIPMDLVDDLGTSIHLTVAVEALDRPLMGERWWRDNFIARIPGATR